MTTLYEEKASQCEENVLPGKCDHTDNDVCKNEVLDEIAARVNAIDLQNTDLVEEPKDGKKSENIDLICQIREQRETINNLVNYLRQMFDENRALSQGREQQDELTEALLQCLEIEELKRQGLLDESDLMIADDIATRVNAACEDGKSNEACAADATTKSETVPTKPEVTQEAHDDKDNEGLLKLDTKQRECTKEDLLRVNSILLREIYHLRFQIEEMKDSIRDFLYSTGDEESEGEYDTADEDGGENVKPGSAEPASEKTTSKSTDSQR